MKKQNRPPSTADATRQTPDSPKSVTPPPAGANHPELERALALRDVMDHAVRVEREITDPRPLGPWRGGRAFALFVCVPLLALSAYSWFARPEFIWGPNGQTVAPERREANMRFIMFLMARRLEAFKARAGNYPTSLVALGGGVVPSGISFRTLGDSAFELRAMENGKPLVLRSNESATAFLGSSPRIIGGDTK